MVSRDEFVSSAHLTCTVILKCPDFLDNMALTLALCVWINVNISVAVYFHMGNIVLPGDLFLFSA
jgi:hypothetical protein